MNILIYSRCFLPSTGGIETVSDAIARALSRRNQRVTIITETPADVETDVPYRVIRQPSPRRLLAAVRTCDIYVHNNISLRAAWPLLLTPRPWLVIHHISLRRNAPAFTVLERAKYLALHWARSVAISAPLARELPIPALVIPDCYRDDLFQLRNHGQRRYELVFLGRLIPEKGCALLLDALARLGQKGLRPRLVIIGDGPEAARLCRLAGELGITPQIEFTGPLAGENLVRRLNEARILVVPSLCAESFGIVALEGIACGLAIIGSSGGGLPEAIGPCGVTFPSGDVAALAARIAELLCNPARTFALRARAPEHLARYTADATAEALLPIMMKEQADFRPYRWPARP